MYEFQSAYLESFTKGTLKEKAETGRRILQSCMLCPRECAVHRLSGETGICKTAQTAIVLHIILILGKKRPCGYKWFRHYFFCILQPAMQFLSKL